MSEPDRCLNDARALAAHLGIGDVEALHRLYASIDADAPAGDARSRFGSVLAGDRP